MKNLWILLLSIFIISSSTIRAQEIITFAKITDFRWKLSYFGESAIHPGLQLGVEQRLTSWDKTKEPKKAGKSQKFIYREFYGNADLLGYNFPNNEIFFAATAGIGYRRVNQIGRFRGPTLKAGYFRTIYNIPTYELEDTEVNKVSLAGREGFLLSLGYQYGGNIYIKDKNLSWYLAPSIIMTSPHNHEFTFTSAFELGIIVHAPFLKFEAKQKVKQKEKPDVPRFYY